MKKCYTVLFFLTFFCSIEIDAQCVTAATNLFPTTPITLNCDDPTTIIENCQTDDYTLVNVLQGQEYTFYSSVYTDKIFLHSADGNTLIASTSYPEGLFRWYSTLTGTIRFSTHSSGCFLPDEARIRGLNCGLMYPPCADPIVDIPYSMGFEFTEDFGCYTYEGSTNGGAYWMTGIFPGPQRADESSSSIAYQFSTTMPGDDWFFTHGLNLNGGTEYQLTFKYKGSHGNIGFSEDFEVKFGDAATSSSMIYSLLSLNNIVSSEEDPFETATTTFIPAMTGVYYLGFHSMSQADQGYIYVDNINVTQSLSTNSEIAPKPKIFPNPATDIVYFKDISELRSIRIYNLLGQEMVNNYDGNNQSVDISNLLLGTYLVTLLFEDGLTTLRLIKD